MPPRLGIPPSSGVCLRTKVRNMDQQSTTISELAGVEADLVYLAPMTERPHSYTYDPPPNVPRTNTVNVPHRVTVHDARPIARDLSLDREGFELMDHHSAVRDFYDEDELRRVYYPEAERLVAQDTGATASSSSTTRSAGVNGALRIARRARPANPQPACTTTTPSVGAAAYPRPDGRGGGCTASTSLRVHQCLAADPWTAARRAAGDVRCAVCVGR